MRSFDDFSPWIQFVKRLHLKKIRISPNSDSLEAIFKRYPKLVVAINHGPMLAPGLVNMALVDTFIKHGGADRTYIGVVWKHFYKVPVLNRWIKAFTNIDEPMGFDRFFEVFQQSDCNDFLVMPEGENCSFGNGVDIEPFLSPRFLEVAIRAGVPVLLAVHHGTHRLARPVPIRRGQLKYFRWLPEKNIERLREARLISLPRFSRVTLPELRMSFRLYHPSCAANELPVDRDALMQRLDQEAETVRGIMQSMVDELRQTQPKPYKGFKAA